MKLNIFKNKKSFQKVRIMSSPHFFWMLILLMMAVMVVFSFVFGILLFLKVNKEPAFSVDDSSGEIETVSQEKLKGTLKYFSDRQENLTKILNSQSPVVDPSL